MSAGLLFDAAAVSQGWIRVGGILLATFGLQYLGAALFDWHSAATSRPAAAGTSSTRNSKQGTPARKGNNAAAAAGLNIMQPPEPLIEAYATMDGGDMPLPGKEQGRSVAKTVDTIHKEASSTSVDGFVDISSSHRLEEQTLYPQETRNTSAKTLSRGLDATARRQHKTKTGWDSTGTGAIGSSSDSASDAGGGSSADSRSSMTKGILSAAPTAGLRPAVTATWAYSSSGFYTATIWSRLFLVAGFGWLVVSKQVQPGLLLLAAFNLLGALKMWFALRQQHLYHVMGEAPEQSVLGWLLEGALR